MNNCVGRLRLAREDNGDKDRKYLPCPACLKWMRERELIKHQKKCTCRNIEHISIKKSKKEIKRIPNLTEKGNLILSGLSSDKISASLKSDAVACEYINSLGEEIFDKQDLQHLKVLRGKVRLVARFLHTAKMSSGSPSLSELLCNDKFQTIVEITRNVPVKEGSSSNTHRLIGFEIKLIIQNQLDKVKNLAISTETKERIKSLKYLLSSMNKPWTKKIALKVHHTVAEKNRNRRKTLSPPTDILKVLTHCAAKLKEALTELDSDELLPKETYRSFEEYLYVWITAFNFR